MDPEDPLLAENKGRYVIFPVKNELEWRSYKDKLHRWWPAEVVQVAKDVAQLPQVSDELLRAGARYATQGSGPVPMLLLSILASLMNEVQMAEARCAIGIITSLISVHMEALSLWLRDMSTESEVVREVVEKEGPKTEPVCQWLRQQVMDPALPFRLRLANLIVFLELADRHAELELQFYNLRGQVMDEILQTVQRIRRDREWLVLICLALPKPKAEDPALQVKVREAVREFAEMEIARVPDVAGHSDESLSQSHRVASIQYFADLTLQLLSYAPLYGTAPPLPWVVYLGQKTEKLAELPLRTSGPVVQKSQEIFALDEDF